MTGRHPGQDVGEPERPLADALRRRRRNAVALPGLVDLLRRIDQQAPAPLAAPQERPDLAQKATGLGSLPGEQGVATLLHAPGVGRTGDARQEEAGGGPHLLAPVVERLFEKRLVL